MPEGCAATRSSIIAGGSTPASWASMTSSTSVRTCSRPSEEEMWPVTVSASTSRTRRPIAASAAETLIAIVVLPTPPFGLKTATSVPLRDQLSMPRGPVWMIAPVPSSTAIRRMSIASTRQRIASGV